MARVAEALAKLSRYQTNRDLIPVEVWERLAQAKGGRSWAAVARSAGLPGRLQYSCWQARSFARAAARPCCRSGSAALRQLAESDVYWDEIVSIEHAGDKQVYDLTIPETHNFIANDLCVHNTALAMNIAEHVAVDQQKPVAVFSLEMSAQQLVQRLLCSRAKVNLGRVRDGFLAERDFSALTAFGLEARRLQDVHRRHGGHLDPGAAREGAPAEEPARIEAIFIDYLQLLRSTTKRAQDNRQLEIAEISSGLKALAKELEVPIVVLAQLNRNPEQRAGDAKGRPRLSDLRESGSIEQDADLVGLLVREEYYAD